MFMKNSYRSRELQTAQKRHFWLKKHDWLVSYPSQSNISPQARSHCSNET